MSKKSRRSKQRVNSYNSRSNRLFRTSDLNRRSQGAREDLRRFSPAPYSFPLHDDGTTAKLLLTEPNTNRRRSTQTKAIISFANPRRVVVCQKRRERRESLFARRSIGKGKRVSQKRLRNENSDIKCDRRRR